MKKMSVGIGLLHSQLYLRLILEYYFVSELKN